MCLLSMFISFMSGTFDDGKCWRKKGRTKIRVTSHRRAKRGHHFPVGMILLSYHFHRHAWLEGVIIWGPKDAYVVWQRLNQAYALLHMYSSEPWAPRVLNQNTVPPSQLMVYCQVLAFQIVNEAWNDFLTMFVTLVRGSL